MSISGSPLDQLSLNRSSIIIDQQIIDWVWPQKLIAIHAYRSFEAYRPHVDAKDVDIQTWMDFACRQDSIYGQ